MWWQLAYVKIYLLYSIKLRLQKTLRIAIQEHFGRKIIGEVVALHSKLGWVKFLMDKTWVAWLWTAKFAKVFCYMVCMYYVNWNC